MSVFNATVVDHAATAFGALLFLAMSRYVRDVEVQAQYTKPSRCTLWQIKLQQMRSQARATMQVGSWILRMSSFLHLVSSVGIAVLPSAPNRSRTGGKTQKFEEHVI